MFVLCCLEAVQKQKKSCRCYLHKIVQREEKQQHMALLIYVVSTHFCAWVLTF